MDRPFYTDAWTHLKTFIALIGFMFDFKIERIRKTAIDYSKNLAFKVLWFFPDDNWCRFGNQETPFYKMSFFSSSSGHRVGELEEWTSEIYFDPEADSSSGSDYRISDSELRSRMEELIKGSEDIEEVRAYQCPLFGVQLTQYLLNHQFIMLETNSWWWSVEKNTEGITIQRSKKIEYVRDRYRRNARPKDIILNKTDEGRKTMQDLVDYIYTKDELNKKYCVYTDNCKHFAKRIFDEVAKSKYL